MREKIITPVVYRCPEEIWASWWTVGWTGCKESACPGSDQPLTIRLIQQFTGLVTNQNPKSLTKKRTVTIPICNYLSMAIRSIITIQLWIQASYTLYPNIWFSGRFLIKVFREIFAAASFKSVGIKKIRNEGPNFFSLGSGSAKKNPDPALTLFHNEKRYIYILGR